MKNEIEVLTTTPEEYINNWVSQHRYYLWWSICGDLDYRYYSSLDELEADGYLEKLQTTWKYLANIELIEWTDLEQAYKAEVVEALNEGRIGNAVFLLKETFSWINPKTLISKTADFFTTTTPECFINTYHNLTWRYCIKWRIEDGYQKDYYSTLTEALAHNTYVEFEKYSRDSNYVGQFSDTGTDFVLVDLIECPDIRQVDYGEFIKIWNVGNQEKLYDFLADYNDKHENIIARKVSYYSAMCGAGDNKLKFYYWPDPTTDNLTNKTNFELTAILRFCVDLDCDLLNQAGVGLLAKNPTNLELTQIIVRCSDASLRNRAWETLLTQNPTDYDLDTIIWDCADTGLRICAGKLCVSKYPNSARQLALHLGISQKELGGSCQDDVPKSTCGGENSDANSNGIINEELPGNDGFVDFNLPF
jgi:hypothetical protein